MSLHNHSILIIDQEIDAFVTALHVVLVGVGAKTVIVVGEERAIELGKQAKFSAVLIGTPPLLNRELFNAFSGTPIIFYDQATNVVPIKRIQVAPVPRDIPAILRTLEKTLRAS
jgi:hypothetical protein